MIEFARGNLLEARVPTLMPHQRTEANKLRADTRQMKPSPEPRPVTPKDVEKFKDYCVVLRAWWLHYQTLFEGNDLKRELLQRTANTFFNDLNQALIEHLILQICRLTDNEFTGDKRNFAISFLINNADFSAERGELIKLKASAKRIEEFRKLILPARNKLIGHLDLEAAHGTEALGGAAPKAWQQFWLDLQEFVMIIYARFFPSPVPFYLNAVGQLSDVDQLLKAIRESTYFHAVLDDHALTQRAVDIAFASKFHDAQ